MLKANFTSLQSTALSQPVTYSRKATSETEVTPTQPQMIQYGYPMMYPGYQMVPAQPTMAMQPMAQAAPASPVNMSISPTGEMVTPMGLHYQYTSSESLYQMAQAGTPIVPTPAQPTSYPQQAVISVKPADQMNVFETSNWVRLVCEVQGWPEAPTYAQNFFNHGVTGIMLAQLTVDDLEIYLGVEKLGHRNILMSSIQAIFPFLVTRSSSAYSSLAPSTAGESTAELSEVESDLDEMTSVRPELKMVNSGRRRSVIVTENLSQRNLLSHEKSMGKTLESITLKRPQLIDESSCTSATSNNSMASYASASSQVTDTSVASSINGDRRCHLTLTMDSAPACNREAILSIRQTFQQAGFDAHPRPSDRFNNKFIIQFRSYDEANRALSMKDNLGYDLSDYTETRKKGPRPTPSNPQQYMVLHHARMRSGKSMKSQVLGFVEKGEIFWVNQIKGKRARLIERTKDGDKNLGWVSLRNNAGFKFLQKVANTGCQGLGHQTLHETEISKLSSWEIKP